MGLGFPRKDDDVLMYVMVNIRKLYDEGKYVGTMNNNRLLDTRTYTVDFSYVKN